MWNTKMLIMYARAHGYTPSCSYSIFENNLSLKPLLTSYEVKNSTPKPIPEPNVPINITDVDNGEVDET